MTEQSSNFTRHIQAVDNAHHLHPFTTHHQLRAKNPRVIVGAEGVYIKDSEGNKILDAMSGLWCVNLGYSQSELVEAGRKALEEIPYYNTFFQTTTPPAAILAQKIAEKTPGDLDHIFFASSGSEANDTGVKLIWYYNNLKGRPNKKQIIARNKAYHGSTIMAASLTGLPHMHEKFDCPRPGFHHIEPTPYAYRYAEDGESEAAFATRCAQALEDKILELGADNVAAFIGEPIMGAGGLMVPPAGYWQKIRAICDKYDVILWADEVICGFGRTGSWFGCQTYDFMPDMITMAKGLSNGFQPISALAFNDEIGQTLINSDYEMAHGYTYSGHPVAASVAIKTLELYESTGAIGSAGQDASAYFQARIRELSDHPIVGEVRGVGFLGAVELVADKASKARFQPDGRAGGICRDYCSNSGLISRAVGDVMIMAPPLVISKSEIDELHDKLRSCLDKTWNDLNGETA